MSANATLSLLRSIEGYKKIAFRYTIAVNGHESYITSFTNGSYYVSISITDSLYGGMIFANFHVNRNQLTLQDTSNTNHIFLKAIYGFGIF